MVFIHSIKEGKGSHLQEASRQCKWGYCSIATELEHCTSAFSSFSVMQVTDSYEWYLYIPSKKARDLTFRRHPGSVSGVTVRLPLSWSTAHPLFLLFRADSFILRKIACTDKFWGVF